jgi:hypothetical protein
VAAVHGRSDWQVNEVISWPSALGANQGGFTFPKAGGWAAKLFSDVGPDGRMTLLDPRRGERLELAVRRDEVPQVGLWINCRGWAPAGFTPYYNLALEPCIGAPDRLDVAVADWKTARWLGAGEERQWSLDVRLLDEDD